MGQGRSILQPVGAANNNINDDCLGEKEVVYGTTSEIRCFEGAQTNNALRSRRIF